MNTPTPETQAAVKAILDRYMPFAYTMLESVCSGPRYDLNKDSKLSKEEVARIVEDYHKNKESLPPEVLAALQRYDQNSDGTLDAKVRD